MRSLQIFKVFNIITTILIFIVFLNTLDYQLQNKKTNWLYSIIEFLVLFIIWTNCIFNLYLTSLFQKNLFFTKTSRIFYWISYSLFILVVLTLGILMGMYIIEMASSGHMPFVAFKQTLVLISLFLCIAISTYISIHQPFIYSFVRRHNQQENERNISSIGS